MIACISFEPCYLREESSHCLSVTYIHTYSWVEVYVVSNEAGKSGEWMFLEPTPGIAEGKEDTANADNLDRDPCKRWFCKAERFNGSTKVYATRYDKQVTSFFPMAWADNDKGVPGDDRSKFYTSTCGRCV